MTGENAVFGDKNINISPFNKHKKLIQIDSVNVIKIYVSKKEPYGKKGFLKYILGYDDNDDIRQLCIKLPQMMEYAKYIDSNKTMSFRDKNIQ